MSSTLEAYREAKSNYLKLRNQAKKELIARYHEVAGELLALQRELLEDFGEKVALPKGAARKAKGGTKAAPKAEPAAEPSPKVAALQKQLAKQKEKLAAMQSAGKPTKAVEDRIYEIEDEIRLAGNA